MYKMNAMNLSPPKFRYYSLLANVVDGNFKEELGYCLITPPQKKSGDRPVLMELTFSWETTEKTNRRQPLLLLVKIKAKRWEMLSVRFFLEKHKFELRPE